MTKQCPKCLYETNESEWEYCRPCKENDEFVRMVVLKRLITLISFIGLFFFVGRTIWSISEENYRKLVITPSKFDQKSIVFLDEKRVTDFVKGFNR